MVFSRRALKWLAILLGLMSWGLALPLSLLFVSHNESQLVWILLPYAWEVPILGLGLILLPARKALEPVAEFLDARPPPTDQARLGRVRRHATNLPMQAALMVWAANLVIYLLVAVQMRCFGDLPGGEALKSLVLGLPIGLLHGLLVYFLLGTLLGPPLERCEALLEYPRPSGPRVPLFWKTFACLLATSVLAVSVMGVLSYSSSQRLLEANLASATELQLVELGHAIATGRPWAHLLEFQGQASVGLISSSGRLISYRGPSQERFRLVDDTEKARGSTGVCFLRSGEARLLAWRSIPGDLRAVAEVPLSVHAEALTGELRTILVMAALTLSAAFLLALVLARSLSRPVVALTALAARVPQEWPAEPQARHSDDEIGTLSLAFQGMLGELRRNRDDLLDTNRLLGQMIAERTLAMRDLETLLDLSQLLSSTLEIEPVLEELLVRTQSTLQADGAAILLQEHQHLACLTATGAASPSPGRRIPSSLAVIQEALARDHPLALLRGQPGTEIFLPPKGDLRSAILVPMLGRERPVGLLNLYFEDDRALSPEALNLLRSIANQAEVAISNSRLFRENRRVTDLLYSVLRPPDDLGFPGLEVGCIYTPSKELSGDYLDLIPLGENRVAVTIADVAGRGSEAAIEAVRIKHTIQICAAAGYPPGLLVTLLNEQLHRTSEGPPRTVTLFYGEMDLARGTFRFVSAGHEPPIIWHPGAGAASLLGSGGIVLGAVPDAVYEEVVMQLERGSWMALYTDGITEARSPAGEFFGQERLLELLASTQARTARSLAESVDREVQRFVRGRLLDDLSLLVLRCL